MSSEYENRIFTLELNIIELQEKIAKLEHIISNNYVDYNVKTEVNLDNISCTRSIHFSEPKLERQNAFIR
jgi:hypothetical protein